MKKLIEKGIGAILLCLQIIMAAATVGLLLFAMITSVYQMVIEDSFNEDLPILSVVFILLGIVMYIFVFVSAPCLATLTAVPCGLLCNIFQKRTKSNFYYNFKKVGEIDEIIHKTYNGSIGQSAADRIVTGGSYQHKMSLKSATLFISPMEWFLRNADAAILLSRCSKEDIESNRNEANANMAFYLANKDEVERRFKKLRDQRENRNQEVETCMEFLADYIKSLFRAPIIHYSHVCRDLLLFVKRRGIIILFTGCSLVVYRRMGIDGSGLFALANLFVVGAGISAFFVTRDALGIAEFSGSIPSEYEDPSTNYKECAFACVDFITAWSYFASGKMFIAKYHILDIFQAFLDLHKEGWRMKIFPFSAERVRQEKADAAARGEEIVIFPDVDEIEARLAEEERKEQRIASIGEL